MTRTGPGGGEIVDIRHATDGILRVRTLLEAWADAAHILWLHSPDSRTELRNARDNYRYCATLLGEVLATLTRAAGGPNAA
jgi:hypothetical protein